jgi:FimV-like protein
VQLAALRWRDPADALDLGDRLRDEGDLDGARTAFGRAADSGHPDLAPAGSWWLATVARDAGDPVAAVAAYQRAVDSGHPTWSVRAAIDLADVLRAQGDPAGALAHYQAVVDAVDPGDRDGPGVWAHLAAVRLAVLLAERGDPDRAEQVQLRATAGEPARAVGFTVDRAEELRRLGDVDAAAAAYREAIGLAGGTTGGGAARVSFQLGTMLREHGDLDGAREALREAAASGDPRIAPQANELLRQLSG